MKRNAAIVGPTPAFVRWSIRQKCSLRQETDIRDPEQTMRCLGSVREVNCAIAEERVVDGYGLKLGEALDRDRADEQRGSHSLEEASINSGTSSAKSTEVPAHALAFSVNEVLGPFGGLNHVRDTCAACPGNIAAKNQFNHCIDDQMQSSDRSFAGCFGQITIDDFQAAEWQLPEALAEMLPEACLPSQPFWFGLWCKKTWQKCDLNVLSKVFEQLVVKQQITLEDSVGEKNFPKHSNELLRFEEAVKNCSASSLELDIESYPAGFSDGLNWQIESHCGRCKAFQKNGVSFCGTCGRQGGPQATRKRKVLGLRPYVSITDLVDSQVAAQLYQRFLQNNG